MERFVRTKSVLTWRQGLAATLLMVAALVVAGPALAQRAFPTPEAAVDALVDGLARHDDVEVRAVLGPDYRRLMPLDTLSEADRTNFLAAWARGHRVERTETRARLVLDDGWTLPLPLARDTRGWVFDVKAGEEEMRVRRIGRNELAAIATMYAYLDAQREYATQDRDGDGILEYARRFLSTPGRQDGLYWPTAEGAPPSPAGPLFDTRDIKDGYHGYRFRILEAQGPAARGGARSYLRRGHLANGYALVAWPAHYGDTGVMSFLINHDGIVFQKDLGPASASIAGAMRRFDPDSSWTALPAP